MAFIGASVISKFISFLIDKFLCWLLRMKELSAMDEFFLYDDKNSLANTCICTNFTPFKFEEMSAYFKLKFGQLDNFRVRLYDIFGKQYFKKLTMEEWDEVWPRVAINVTHVHT